jgi:ABC-type cobalamin transport system permease subunit
MIRRPKDAPFLLASCAMLMMATLLLVVFDRRILLQQRSLCLCAGVGLMLAASILLILAVLAAMDHNLQGEFCLGDNFTSDCDWDYLKLGMIGVIWWGTIQSLVFFSPEKCFSSPC